MVPRHLAETKLAVMWFLPSPAAFGVTANANAVFIIVCTVDAIVLVYTLVVVIIIIVVDIVVASQNVFVDLKWP